MTTSAKADANRRNALASTGPRTPEGKSRTSRNATRHGVLSALAVVPGLEKAADWEAHRSGIVAALAPVGDLEALLADRVALSSWRLLRLARYEREAVAVGLEAVEDEVAEKRAGETLYGKAAHPRDLRAAVRNAEKTLEDRTRFYASLARRGETKPVPQEDAEAVLVAVLASARAFVEVPEDLLEKLAVEGFPEGESLEDFDGWTAGLLRATLNALAAAVEVDLPYLTDEDLQRLRKAVEKAREADREARVQVDRLRRSRVVPGSRVLDKVSRYESHLERGLYKALHELQRLQAARGGRYVPPPVALDMDLTLSTGDREPLEASFEEV